MNEIVNKSLRAARRVVITVVGVTLLLIGMLLLVLPGPALVVIPSGLALLATEFLWARRLLRKVKRTVEDTVDRVSDGR